MKVLITEYLRIDLDTEKWECRKCSHVHGDARENYKKFLLIYDRNPQEIHPPLLDPKRYRFNFSPDPTVCVIYEFYCSRCGTLVETEYTIPGAMPLHDIEYDIDAMKQQWASRKEINDGGADTEGLPPSPAAQRGASCGHRH